MQSIPGIFVTDILKNFGVFVLLRFYHNIRIYEGVIRFCEGEDVSSYTS